MGLKYNRYFQNLIFNLLALATSMGLSFRVTSYTVNTIGAESYGFVPPMRQLIIYMTVITISIALISARSFTVAKERNAK